MGEPILEAAITSKWRSVRRMAAEQARERLLVLLDEAGAAPTVDLNICGEEELVEALRRLATTSFELGLIVGIHGEAIRAMGSRTGENADGD